MIAAENLGWAALTNGYLYPSLWIDLVTYLLTLLVGWRYVQFILSVLPVPVRRLHF